MKNILIVLAFAAFVVSCNGGNKEATEQMNSNEDAVSLVSYKYKVAGIQDEAIADSIFHLHFKIEGIDKMIISEKDCTVVLTVDPAFLNDEGLRKAIREQGGVIID